MKKDSRGLSRVAAGNPRFPRLLLGTRGNFPGCLGEARDAVELAGPLGTPLGLAQWKRASSRGEAGSSGFLSVLDSDHRIPVELGQESQTSSCLRKGTPLASRVAQGVSGPSPSCVWNLRVFPDDARGCHAPSCCAFAHRAAFEEVSGHRVLIKSRPGNPGRLARGTTHVASLEFPRETGLILRCARKAGKPFQTKQGNRLSCRDQEGKRCSDEVVPGPSVFPRREPGVSGNFWAASRVSSTVSHLRTERGTSLETP